jgi:hypothetical protein
MIEPIKEMKAGSLGQTPVRMQELMLIHFEKADPDYTRRIQKFLVGHEHLEFAHGPNEAESEVRLAER